MGDVTAKIESVDDARYFAERRLPRSLFQLFEAGSGTNLSVRRNLEAFEEVLFRPRAGVWHPQRDLRTTVLGHEVSMPILLAPVGSLGVGHRDGEAGAARAAAQANTIMIVSGATATPIEEIVAAASGPVFYQLYFMGGRDASAAIVERVKRAGVSGLVVTLDKPAMHVRERPYRERAAAPQGIDLREPLRFAPQALARPSWFYDYLRDGIHEPVVAMALDEHGRAISRFKGGNAMVYEQTPRWEDLSWIRELWDGPLIAKGILRVDDARRAVAEDVDAIVVSNHGGNVLDGSIPPLHVLPEIVAAVGDRTEVLLDSGVRRGADVLRAVALGAKAVLIGRAYLYGLLAAGAPGVEHMLELLRKETDDGLAFLGAQSIHELNRSFLDLSSHEAGEGADKL